MGFVFIIIGIIGIATYKCIDYNIGEGAATATTMAGICSLIFGIIVIGWASWALVAGRDVDDRIAMYEEQNAKIEEQVAAAVQVYMQHENLVFDSTTPDSYITLVSLYPELKSDELMQKQIDVYISNNEKICKLKEEQITLQRAKFWLYFGR